MSRNFEDLDQETQEILNEIIETKNESNLTSDDKEILWEKRHYLALRSEALPLVILSAISWSWALLPNMYQLLKIWKPLSPSQALELLLPQFPDREIRKYACDILKGAGGDFLCDFLPQLTEALRFEPFEDCALISLLLQKAIKNRRFSFQLFWCLEGQKSTHSPFSIRCALIQKILLHISSKSFGAEIERQTELNQTLGTLATAIKPDVIENDFLRKKKIVSEMLRLDANLLTTHTRLPIKPSFVAAGVYYDKCDFFSSKCYPLKVIFRGIDSSIGVIFKVGDDIRKDSLVLQMIRLINEIWLEADLDLKMLFFACLPLSEKKGMIEIVPNCETLCKIQGPGGGINKKKIQEWLKKHTETEYDYKNAVDNFANSCAGWCVATYVLGIGDRHNDNIMLTKSGELFHIDFGKFFGDWEYIMGVKRDRAPFVLTEDMIYIINDSREVEDRVSPRFQEFVMTCCKAFNLLRRRHSLLTNLMKLMVCSGIPGFTQDAVAFMLSNLFLDCSELEATSRFSQLIEKSAKTSFTVINNIFHFLANPKIASYNVDTLSFVPEVYSQASEGRIESIEVVEVFKYRNPEKVYMYTIETVRENVAVPTRIYRSYDEFFEFYSKMRERFPLCPLMTVPHPVTIFGRSNIHDVAEKRKNSMNLFLKSLLKKNDNGYADEVSHCNLVYTFTHPLLRDHDEGMRANVATSNPHQQQQQPFAENKIGGEIHMGFTFKNGVLEILVRHLKSLPLLPNKGLPDSYVKCYLRSSTCRKTKRKTRCVRQTQNPIFNEIIIYQLNQSELTTLQLEVTVWHYDRLGGNSFLGGVLIPLYQLADANDKTMNNCAFKLDHINT